MHSYFTDYEARLAVANRHPVLVRLIAYSFIVVSAWAVPLLLTWTPSARTWIAFAGCYVVVMLASMGYYFVVERARSHRRP